MNGDGRMMARGALMVAAAAAGILAVAAAPAMAQRGAAPERQGMQTSREIYGYVQDLIDFGPRRTGSEANVRTADYIADKFRSSGLQDVEIKKGDTTQWSASRWGLSVDGVGIPAFYMRHSFNSGRMGAFGTGPDGLKAEFVYVGNRKDLTGIDVRGKIVVADVELRNVDIGVIQRGAKLVYDPARSIQPGPKLDPFTPNNFPFNFASAMKGGAVGFVGVLSNYFDSNRFYNEDLAYFVDDDLHLSLPGLWLNRKDGETLKAALRAKPHARGRLDLDGDIRKVQYRTVVGYLPGRTKELLMVQSHHDSGFAGAVEDASGTAEVLALADYYGRRPAAARNRGMMFVAMDSHFTGYEAHEDFARKTIIGEGRDVVANVTVEHVAREMAVRDGKAELTGQVDPRIFITSPSLLELTSDRVRKHDYRRSLVVSTKMFPDEAGLPTDVGPIKKITGFPVISLISAPAYLYDVSDTLDKVAVEELQPTATLAADLLDALDAMPRDKLGRDK